MKTLDKTINFLFYTGIILFFLGFNFSDNPPGGWYLQTMPDLNGRQISDMVFIDSLTGYATAYISNDTNYTLKTTNGGYNWFFIYRDYSFMKRVQFLNVNTGFLCGSYLKKTTNGGLNWAHINTNISVENMHVLNEDTMWIISPEPLTGGVFRTTNGGQSWVQQLSAGNRNPDKIYMYNARIGFVCDAESSSALRKTTDGGNSWIELIPNDAFIDMFFADSLIGWRTRGQPDSIKKTTDGGLNWTKLLLPRGGLFFNLSAINSFSFINKDTLWGVGARAYTTSGFRGLIYISTNGGNNWGYQLPDINQISITRYFHSEFVNRLNGWAYSPGNGVHTVTGGDSTIFVHAVNTSNEVPLDYILSQNYPNPFNQLTIISYQLPNKANVKVIVYDIIGKETAVLVNSNQNAGKYDIRFDAGGYSSGIYFYTLFIDGRAVLTKKAVLIK